MTLIGWLQGLRTRWFGSPSRKTLRRQTHRRRASEERHPALVEQLERRTLLTAPVADDDGPFAVYAGQTYSSGSFSVLTNDTDVDENDELTASLTNFVSDFTLNPDGTFTWVVDSMASGLVSIGYTVSDLELNTSNEAFIRFDVNGGPAASDDTYDAVQGQVLEASSVLDNDWDPESDSLTATLVDAPAWGDLDLNEEDGTFTFDPGANYGSVTFTYMARDENNDSNTATVTINVNGSPIAVDDSDTTINYNPGQTVYGNVLPNDSDPENDTLTVIEVIEVNGLAGLTLNPDGTYQYVVPLSPEPTSPYATFTYKLNDGHSDSNVATVTIGINLRPQGSDDSYTVTEENWLYTSQWGNPYGVLANDYDGNPFDYLSAEVVTGPSNGTLYFYFDGQFSYLPNTDFVGTDTFTYLVTDVNGLAANSPTTVSINVTNVNDTPTIGSTTGYLQENTDPEPIMNVGGADVDGDTLTYTLTTATGYSWWIPQEVMDFMASQFQVNPNNGDISLANGITGLDAEYIHYMWGSPYYYYGHINTYYFYVTATDDDYPALSVTELITIHVGNENEKPEILRGPSEYVTQDHPFDIVLTEHQPVGNMGSILWWDPDFSDTHTIEIVSHDFSTPVNEFRLDAWGNLWVEVDLDYEATTKHDFEFAVRITDANGLSDEQDFTITVTNVNEAVTFNADEYSAQIYENSTDDWVPGWNRFVTSTDIDLNDTADYTIVQGWGDYDKLSIDSSSGEITLNQAWDHEYFELNSLSDTFTVLVCVTDSGGLTDYASVNVQILDIAEFDAEMAVLTQPIWCDICQKDKLVSTTADGRQYVVDFQGSFNTVDSYFPQLVGGDTESVSLELLVDFDPDEWQQRFLVSITLGTQSAGGFEAWTPPKPAQYAKNRGVWSFPMNTGNLPDGTYDYVINMEGIWADGTSDTKQITGTYGVKRSVGSHPGSSYLRIPGLDYLTEHPDTGDVTIHTGTGRASKFLASEGFATPPGATGELTAAAGGWIWHGDQGLKKHFDEDGRLFKVVDRYGNDTTFEYIDADSDGFLDDIRKIAHPDGRNTWYEYTNGKLTSYFDKFGRGFGFSWGFENSGNTVQGVYGDDIDELNGIERGFLNRYVVGFQASDGEQYDVSADSGGVHSVTSPTGAVEDYTPAEGVASWTMRLEDDPVVPSAGAVENHFGNETSYELNRFGSPTKYVYPGGHARTFVRDDDNLVTSETLPDPDGPTGPLGPITYTYAYDTGRRMTSRTRTVNGVVYIETWTYGGTDQFLNAPISYTNSATGDAITYVRNAGGDIEEELLHGIPIAKFSYDSFGRMTGRMVTSDPDGPNGPLLEGWYNYMRDALGRVWQETDPTGHVTTYTYDAYDNVTSRITPDGTLTTYNVDWYGVVHGQTMSFQGYPSLTNSSQLTRGGKNQGSWNALGNHVSSFAYTFETGLLESSTSALGEVTSFTYDVYGRVKTETSGETQTQYFYDEVTGNLTKTINALNEETLYEYDLYGRQTGVRNPEGQWSYTTYNEFGNVISTTDFGGRLTTNEYYNNGAGRLWKVTDHDGNVTEYEYNLLGQQTQITYPAPNPAQPSVRPTMSYTYDNQGRVLTETNALGHVTEYKYDLAGRRTHVILPDPDGSGLSGGPLGPPTTVTEYDNMGRVKKVTDAGGAITEYTYDPFGRQILVKNLNYGYETHYTYDLGGRRTASTNAVGEITTYGYNNGDLQTSVITPTGTHSTAYNTKGQSTGSTDSHGFGSTSTYDALGRQESTTDQFGSVTSYVFNNLGQVASTTNDATGTTTYVYDQFGRKTSETNSLGTTLYGYDALDNITSIQYPDPDGSGPRPAPIQKSIYDKLSRLTHSIVSFVGATAADERVTVYEYDLLGRVTKVTEPDPGTGQHAAPVTLYEYNPAGQVTKVTNPLGEVTTYEYDIMGRLLATTEYGHVTSSSIYNVLGWVTSSTDALGNVTNYSYDAIGRLTETKTPDPDGANGPLVRSIYKSVYDAQGRLWKSIESFENATPEQERVTIHAYIGDRLVSSTGPDPDGEGVNNPLTGPVTTYVYSEATGLLESSTNDATGSTTYQYDTRGRQTGSTNALNQASSVTLNVYGHTLTSTDIAGEITTYTNDLYGRVLTTTSPDPDGENGPRAGSVTQYVYNAYGELHQTIETFVGANSNNQRVTTYTYDKLGRQIAVKYPAAGSAPARITRTEYDALGRVTAEIDTYENAPTSDERITSYLYDDGQLIKITYPDPDGSGPLTADYVEYTYDNAGQLLTEADSLGFTTTTIYDALGRVVSTKFENEAPELTTYTQFGEVATTTDTLGRTLAYTYDPLGRMLTSTDAAGFVTTHTYDAAGRLLSTTTPDPDANGPLTAATTTFTYDTLGRRTGSTNPVGGSSSTTFDSNGRVASRTDAEGNTVNYTYDSIGRVLTQTDDEGGTTTYQYDDFGQIVAEITAAGTTTRSYDAQGRLISVTDPEEGETTYTYDVWGNRLTLTTPSNQTTTWTYDRLGRVVSETNPGSAARSFTYDTRGNILTRTDRNGRVIGYEYDDRGRRTVENWYSGNTIIATLSYGYDAAGQLVSIGSPEAAYTLVYDDRGLVTQITIGLTNLGFNVVFEADYDDAGRRTSLVTKIDNVTDFINTYEYDASGRTTRVTQSGTGVATKRVDITYTVGGLIDVLNRYASADTSEFVASSTYTYDDDGRLTSLLHKRNNVTIADYDWTYDANDRLTAFTSALYAAEDATYAYDDTDQLTAANRAGTANDEAYTYDANGNRTGGGHTVDANNHVTADGTYTYLYDAEGNRTRKTLAADPDDYVSYTWDHRNRLTAVQFHTNGVLTKAVTYTYDALNRRVSKSIDETGNGTIDRTDRYVYDAAGKSDGLTSVPLDDVVLTFTATGPGPSSLKTRTLHGPAVDQLFASEDVLNDETFWTFADNQGTIRDIATYDEANDVTTVINHITYDAFGNIISEVDPTTSAAPLTASLLVGQFETAYTGRQWDADTDLYYYRERWYDPKTARFLSEDPLGFDAGDLNLTRYVGNNSPNATDPSGHTDSPQFSTDPYLEAVTNAYLHPVSREPGKLIVDRNGLYVGVEHGGAAYGSVHRVLQTDGVLLRYSLSTRRASRAIEGKEATTRIQWDNFFRRQGTVTGVKSSGDVIERPPVEATLAERTKRVSLTGTVAFLASASPITMVLAAGMGGTACFNNRLAQSIDEEHEKTGAALFVYAAADVVGVSGLWTVAAGTDIMSGKPVSVGDRFETAAHLGVGYGMFRAGQSASSSFSTTARQFYTKRFGAREGIHGATEVIVDQSIQQVPNSEFSGVGPARPNTSPFENFTIDVNQAGSGSAPYAGPIVVNPNSGPASTPLFVSSNLGGTLPAHLKVLNTFRFRTDVAIIDADNAPPPRSGVDLELTYKSGWSEAQRAAARQKAQALTEAETVVIKSPQRSGTSASSRYRQAGNTVPAGHDVDHVIDLQLGGADDILNMNPLDASVNRSLGSQIQHRIKGLPAGTRINRVTIVNRPGG